MAAKIFEVGDVLPEGIIRVYTPTAYSYFYGSDNPYIKTDNDNYQLYTTTYSGSVTDYYTIYIDSIYAFTVYVDGYDPSNPWGGVPTYTIGKDDDYIEFDTTGWSLSKRTISSISSGLLYIYTDQGREELTWEYIASSGYTITFNSNGGTTFSDIEEATELPTLPIPTKSGYTFVAWYIDSALTTRAVAGATIEEDTTLYAKWHNLGSLFTEIANAIREKESSSGTIRDLDFGERIRDLEVGGAELPSTAGGSIFTGATIPLTYKNNTHDYENNYEYKSATHNITITGLDGRATITGNGTKNVLVAFDVTSSTTSLKNFTITCVNGEQELTYKGLHAHYGETVTGILTFAYNNITHDGSEGTFDTSGLTANYKFIVTSSSDLPVFSENTTLWNTIYSYQVLNVLIGNFSGTSIGNSFMYYCYAFNQPLTLPSGLSSIGNNFMRSCYAFNQPLTLPSSLSSIGDYFMSNCYAFNQPLTLPSSLSSIGDYFMSNCYSFNQPLTLPSGVGSIGNSFMLDCRAFNQPLTLPSGLSSIGNSFMQSCYSFNQPLTLPSGVGSIGNSFMYSCLAFNQPLTLPSGLGNIGNYFMRTCYAFNQPLTLPSGLSSIGSDFMYYCYALSTIVWNASVYPTDNNSLSQNINTKTNSTYGAGIKVYGTKRAELISALPNRTSSPYRKLINGGS